MNNVVPYIDVMLVLLVIFMISAPMLSQGVSVDLPKVANQSLKVADREPIIVSVNQDGRFFLNINISPETEISAHDLVIRVAAEVGLAKSSGLSYQVLVKGDKLVSYSKVVEAMSLLKQAGVERVGLLTDPLEINNNVNRV